MIYIYLSTYIYKYIILQNKFRYDIFIGMKNKSKEKNILLLCVLLGIVLSLGIIIVTINYFTAHNNFVAEDIVTDNVPDTVEKSQNQSITIITEEKSTLNQEKSNISAAEQSSLEKAIDDLINLTEME